MHINLFAVSGLLITITCVTLIVILVKFGKTKVHRLWTLFNLSVCIWGFGAFLLGISPTENVAGIVGRIAHIGAIFIPIFFYHTISIFCELYRKKIILFSYIQGVIFSLMFASFTNVKFLTITYVFDSFYYPVFTKDPQGLIFGTVFFLIWISFVIFGHYELFKLYRKSFSEKRNQILYFFVGMATGFSGGAMNFLPAFHINIYPYGNLLIPVYCLIVTYAILRHQLLDIRIVVQKSFVYSVLIAFITATYFVFVFLAERLFQGMVGYTSLIISILYAFVIALFFNPVKDKVQHFADRVFLGKDPIQIARENELMRQELERSERLKTVATFASGMAHEIKNPLTSIKTFTEYLPQKTEDKEFLKKFSKIVCNEVNRVDSLVHQLLDFAKPGPLELQTINIHNLLNDTLNLLNSEFIKHRIELKKEYKATSSKLQADSNQVKQAFLNLFLNAIEAMPDGGALTVKTIVYSQQSTDKTMDYRPSTVDNKIEISITDTGCGIPKKDLPHIFEPFYSKKENGTGLGLSIVYNIIKEHRGNIKVSSKIKEGTRFMIELPIKSS